MYTYAIFNNGREVENLGAGSYATEDEARRAGEEVIDVLCPRLSPFRRHYSVGVQDAEPESPEPFCEFTGPMPAFDPKNTGNRVQSLEFTEDYPPMPDAREPGYDRLADDLGVRLVGE